jgi:hypothetical protein
VILTRSRLCPGPKPGSSLHLHVLSTPPAFVLSQDQTLRKKCGVAGCQPQESCHVADSPPRTQCGGRHDGVINPRPVHDGRGSGSSNEGHLVPRRALLSFQRPLRRGRRVSPPPPSARFTKKAPRSRGPDTLGRRCGRSGLLLRGGSLRDPKQERPGSIARDRTVVQESELPVRRRKRLFPTCRTFPLSSPAGRSSRSASSASPSSFTAP